jgi:DNA polymerase
VLVGECPGDREDIEDEPFVGPAGVVLRRALEEASIDVHDTYLTNAVKHFKFERRGQGKVRLHKKPSSTEVLACRPWLMAELEVTRPSSIVALGATAARSLLGPAFRLTRQRGQLLEVGGLPPVVATYHPAAVLRAPDASERQRIHSLLVADLVLVASAG